MLYLKKEFMNQANFVHADIDVIVFGQTDNLTQHFDF